MIRERILAAGALALAACLAWSAPGAALAQQSSGSLPVPVGAQQQKPKGGNKALMEDWMRQKRLVRDQVQQELQRRNALPRTGQVIVEATILPDPNSPGRSVVRIDSLHVRDAAAGDKAPSREVLPAPTPPTGTRDQGPGRRVSETYTIVDGQLLAKP